MKHTGIRVEGITVKDGKFVRVHKFDVSKKRRIIKSKKVKVVRKT
jgi:hypothetical protein